MNMSTPTRQRCRGRSGGCAGAIAVLCTLFSIGTLSSCSGYLPPIVSLRRAEGWKYRYAAMSSKPSGRTTGIGEAPSGLLARSTVLRLPNTVGSGKVRGSTGSGCRPLPPPPSSTGLFSSPPGAVAAASVEGENENDLASAMSFRSEATTLFLALITGAASGVAVSWFKLAIDWVRHLTYGYGGGQGQHQVMRNVPRFLIPALGGLLVSILRAMGRFPPGLAGSVSELNAEATAGGPASTAARNDSRNPLRYLRKTLAAVATLGTGCSLGPEGPAVEVGMGMSRVLGGIGEGAIRTLRLTLLERKLLLACGAAAGVSAGFNAPVAAVFFALEVVQPALISQGVDEDAAESGAEVGEGSEGNRNSDANKLRQYLFCKTSISSILLASVVSALVSKLMLKDHLIFTLSAYSLASPLMEMPLYLVLGFLSGLAAFVFGRGASFISRAFEGGGPGWTKSTVGSLPPFLRPVTGGLVCGLVGMAFPQILFFGYGTLNGLMANNPIPTASLVALLGVKMFTTAFAAGSGLVGGTFAPSLFMGSMLGAAFHNVAVGCVRTTNASMRTATTAAAAAAAASMRTGWLWAPPSLALADVPAYALVGAGSMLASLFRAPLTASMLLFEIARDYDVILPLMASAGVGSLTADIVESKVAAWERRRRDDDSDEVPATA